MSEFSSSPWCYDEAGREKLIPLETECWSSPRLAIKSVAYG